jgi:hypothetical protein
MAVITANVYRASVVLKSKIAVGHHRSEEINIIAQSLPAAITVLQLQYGSDLLTFNGPNVAIQGALTTMSGGALLEAHAPASHEAAAHHAPAEHATEQPHKRQTQTL